MTDFFFSDILFDNSASYYAFEKRNQGGVVCMIILNEPTKILMTLFPSNYKQLWVPFVFYDNLMC